MLFCALPTSRHSPYVFTIFFCSNLDFDQIYLNGIPVHHWCHFELCSHIKSTYNIFFCKFLTLMFGLKYGQIHLNGIPVHKWCYFALCQHQCLFKIISQGKAKLYYIVKGLANWTICWNSTPKILLFLSVFKWFVTND